MKVVIEFFNGKIIEKSLNDRQDAINYLVGFKGSGFVGYLTDGTFSIILL